MNYKPIVLIIVTLVWLYNMVLDAVRMRSAKNPVPANVADIYDEETYTKWRAYNAEKTRFSMITSTAAFVISFLLLLFSVHAAFAGLFDKSDFMQMFAVMVLETLTELLLIPFAWIETMKIEEKYGFNIQFFLSIYPSRCMATNIYSYLIIKHLCVCRIIFGKTF